MPHGSGLDVVLGIGTESTYGTRVAPATWLPIESESLVLNKEFIESQPLMNGVMVQQKGLLLSSTRTVEGGIEMSWFDRGLGKIFNLLCGGVISPATPGGATNTRTQTFPIGLTSPVGKSLSIQVGRGDTGGTVRPFDYIGCKITELVITIESGQDAKLSFNVDGRDEKTDQTLGTPTYSAAAAPAPFKNWTINVGGSPHTKCRSLTITIPLNFATDRYNIGNSGVKDEPLVNAPSEIGMNATFEFASMADHNRFINESDVALQAVSQGALIEGAHYYGTDISIPAARQMTSGPAVPSGDLVMVDAEFKALWDGTNAPMTIINKNTDTTL